MVMQEQQTLVAEGPEDGITQEVQAEPEVLA